MKFAVIGGDLRSALLCSMLAGDGLLTYAFECVLGDAVKRGGEAALREMRALERIASAAGCGGMVAGQCADLACERAGEDGYKGIVKPNVDASRDVSIHTRAQDRAHDNGGG